MKKICALLLVLGILLIGIGFGYQLYVSRQESFRHVSQALHDLAGVDLTPNLAHQLLNEGVTVFGQRYTLETVTSLAGMKSVDKFIGMLRIYGAMTYVIIAGAVCAVPGLLGLVLFRGRKKR